MKNFKQALLAVAITTVSISSANAYYVKKCWVSPVKPETQQHWQTIRTAIQSGEKTIDLGLRQSIGQATAMIVEGKRVAVAQDSMSGADVASGIGRNTEQQLAVENAMQTQKDVLEVRKEYGHLSTGFSNCKVAQERETTEQVAKEVLDYAVHESNGGGVTARSGHYANRNEAMATRLALHDAKYCTREQADSGLCEKEAPRAGNSLIGSTLFKPAEQGDDNDLDKDALINNMVGLPFNPAPAELSNSSLGIAYQDGVRQNGALKSIAIFALKYVQGQTTSIHEQEHNHNANEKAPEVATEKQAVESDDKVKGTSETPTVEPEKDKSYTGLIRRDVERHFGGGEEYINRKKYIASATEKGVLVEMNKTQGLLKKQIADLIEKEQIKLSLTAGTTTALMRYTGMESKVEQKRKEVANARIKAVANSNR